MVGGGGSGPPWLVLACPARRPNSSVLHVQPSSRLPVERVRELPLLQGSGTGSEAVARACILPRKPRRYFVACPTGDPLTPLHMPDCHCSSTSTGAVRESWRTGHPSPTPSPLLNHPTTAAPLARPLHRTILYLYVPSTQYCTVQYYGAALMAPLLLRGPNATVVTR